MHKNTGGGKYVRLVSRGRVVKGLVIANQKLDRKFVYQFKQNVNSLIKFDSKEYSLWVKGDQSIRIHYVTFMRVRDLVVQGNSNKCSINVKCQNARILKKKSIYVVIESMDSNNKGA